MAKRKTTVKDTKAKETVSNLLKGVLPNKEVEEVDVLAKKNTEKGSEWLQDQIDLLTTENEQLRNDLAQAQNAPVNADGVAELQNGIQVIFNDLENNYLGRNANRTPYLRADVKILLDKFVGTFKFLQKKK